MNKTIEELIEELGEELCKYCFYTDYGEDLNAAKVSYHLTGCEGMYCKEAYENYLEECEEEEE